jgi:sensor histidine kinase regulating citrate/malate metabolism
MDEEDEVGEERMTNSSTFWMAALIIACVIVGAWLFAEQFCRALFGLSPR